MVTLDPAFDSAGAAEEIEMHELVPIIKKPNPRGAKDKAKLHEQFEKFDEVKEIYKERYKVERSFAWGGHLPETLAVRYDPAYRNSRRVQVSGLFLD